MLFTHDSGLQYPRVGGQRVHSRVEALGGQCPLQRHDAVKVAKCCNDAGVGVVVGRHVDGLERRDRAGLGGGDALLQGAHLSAECRLVTHGRGHPSQQRGDLHARQNIPVDVIDEEQHVLVLLVPEELGHGEPGQPDAGADARRLVHLAEHQHGVGQHAGVLHLVPQVVALTGPLTDAGEHRNTLVNGADVANQFLNDNCLADPGPAVGANLAAFHEGGDQVEDLDAGLQDVDSLVLIIEGRWVAVDGPMYGRFHGAQVIQWCAGNVEQSPQGLRTHGNGDLLAGIVYFDATGQSVGGAEGQTTDPVVADVLLHFQHQLLSHVVQFKRVEQIGKFVRGELYVYYGADYLDDFSGGHWLLLIRGYWLRRESSL